MALWEVLLVLSLWAGVGRCGSEPGLSEVVGPCEPLPESASANGTEWGGCRLTEGGSVLSCLQPDSLTAIPQLPAELAHGVREILIRHQGRLERLAQRDLKRYQNLRHLAIQFSALASVENFCLKCLQKLISVSLIGNRIRRIPWQGFVSTSPSFERLDLAGNWIECGCQLAWLLSWANLTRPDCIRLEEAHCRFGVSVAQLYHLPAYVVGREGLTCRLARPTANGSRGGPADEVEVPVEDFVQDHCSVPTASLTSMGPPGVPLFQCTVDPVPDHLANRSIVVQIKTGSETRQTDRVDVRRLGPGSWSISLENVTEVDNGWLLCRWEWGDSPAVALTSLAVRTAPVLQSLKAGRNPQGGAFCTFKARGFPPPSVRWSFRDRDLPLAYLDSDHYSWRPARPPPTEFYKSGGLLKVKTQNKAALWGDYRLELCNHMGCVGDVCSLRPLPGKEAAEVAAALEEEGQADGPLPALPGLCSQPALISAGTGLLVILGQALMIGCLCLRLCASSKAQLGSPESVPLAPPS